MFKINKETKEILCTRGDIGCIDITANFDGDDEQPYTFQVGDVVRFKVMKKNNCDDVVLTKDVKVEEPTEVVPINLDTHDTKIGDVISKKTTYWYEVELNPETAPQTIIANDEKGAKLFNLYPEGGDDNE